MEVLLGFPFLIAIIALIFSIIQLMRGAWLKATLWVLILSNCILLSGYIMQSWISVQRLAMLQGERRAVESLRKEIEILKNKK